jgi:membrane-associated phospholipid phosphatase
VGVMGVIVCSALYIHEPSFPTPDKLLVFGTFIGMAFGQALEVLKRFLPFVGLLLVYESFRGVADNLNSHVDYSVLPAIDKFLFFGHLPTAALQHALWHGHVRWFDFILYLSYMMHFLLPLILAVVIWKMREAHYWRFVTTYLLVSFAAFITFFAYPAAPPWMASDAGRIEPITRISSNVWYALGVHDFPSVYNEIAPNAVAAMPSLHAAYATLFALFMIRLFKSRWRYLALIHPAFIYFGTVYMGEHYAIDEIAGVVYGLAAYFAAPHVLQSIKKFGGKLQPFSHKLAQGWGK